MNSCVVDVQFLQSEDNFIFAKKILVAGITSSFKLYNKEITFQYPNQKLISEPEDFEAFGNIELNKRELELMNALKAFETVIVSSKTKENFIKHYTKTNQKIVVVKQHSDTNGHSRYNQMSEKNFTE